MRWAARRDTGGGQRDKREPFRGVHRVGTAPEEEAFVQGVGDVATWVGLGSMTSRGFVSASEANGTAEES